MRGRVIYTSQYFDQVRLPVSKPHTCPGPFFGSDTPRSPFSKASLFQQHEMQDDDDVKAWSEGSEPQTYTSQHQTINLRKRNMPASSWVKASSKLIHGLTYPSQLLEIFVKPPLRAKIAFVDTKGFANTLHDPWAYTGSGAARDNFVI